MHTLPPEIKPAAIIDFRFSFINFYRSLGNRKSSCGIPPKKTGATLVTKWENATRKTFSIHSRLLLKLNSTERCSGGMFSTSMHNEVRALARRLGKRVALSFILFAAAGGKLFHPLCGTSGQCCHFEGLCKVYLEIVDL